VSDAAAFVRELFGTPGSPAAPGDGLLDRAAAAHADLLARARGDPAVDRSLAPLRAYLAGPAPTAEKRRLLCHPLFVEGLHSLAPFCDELQHWHDAVTAPLPNIPVDSPAPAARAALGNVALAVLLRADRHWQGAIDLCTDVLGRVSFPWCDWGLTLLTDRGDFLANQAVKLTLHDGQACWRLGGGDDRPFLVMDRADCLRVVADNDDTFDGRSLRFPNPAVRPRLQCACQLGHSSVRYDPVGFRDTPDSRAHAGVTGGLVERLLAAIRRNSPAVYREFRALVHTVRGFEFPPSAAGVVDSFSDPTVPGVMGISVPYTPQNELCLDPFCFTWFGHEMGHTKDYLCDNILYAGGESLVGNAAQRTGTIPRYGRPLSVRTIIQVPYVHLYEWALLMDFWAAGFRGLPWRVPDPVAIGDDLAAEIEESFGLIREYAHLTPLGEAAVHHFRARFAVAQARWRLVRGRGRCG
jgi:hypothetical protein